MKTRITKSLLALMLLIFSGSAFGEDFVTVYFHDGSHKRLFLKEVEEITVSKQDLDEVQHSNYQTQVVATNTGAFFQDLNQIDSVVFSQEAVQFPKTEAEVEATIERSHAIAVRTNEIVDSLKATGEYDPRAFAQAFADIPDVIDAEIDESNNCITLSRSDSIYHDFILNYSSFGSDAVGIRHW